MQPSAPVARRQSDMPVRVAPRLPGASTLALVLALGAAPVGHAQALPAPGGPPPVTGQTVTPPAPRLFPETPRDFSVDHPDLSLKQREDRLDALVNSSLASGALNLAEAERVKATLASIEASEDRLRRRHGGELIDSETFRLEGRIHSLAADIHWMPGASPAAP
jgi:hypothetical protein